MSTQRTRGSLHVSKAEPNEVNMILRRIRDELDEIQGLRGNAKVFGQDVEEQWRFLDSEGHLIHAFGTKA